MTGDSAPSSLTFLQMAPPSHKNHLKPIVLFNKQEGRVVPGTDKDSLREATEVDKITEYMLTSRQLKIKELNSQRKKLGGKRPEGTQRKLRKRSRNQLKSKTIT